MPRCSILKENHTTENIADKLKEIMETWGILERVTAIVTDNAKNMVGAVNHLAIRHIPCVAHTINLVLSDGIKNTPTLAVLLDHCADIFTYFKQSKGKQRLRLVQYVPTIWNSRLAIIACLLDMKDELVLAQSHLANAPRFLTDPIAFISAEDWTVLQEVSLISSPLNTMIPVLSGEEYVTASQIIPLVHGVYLKLTNVNDNLTTDTAKLYLTSIKESIQKRLFPYESHTVTKLATFFDPRFKKLAFQSSQRTEEARTMAPSEIKCFLKKQVQPVPGCSSWGVGLLDFMADKVKNQRPSSAAVDATICAHQYVENPCMPQTTNPMEY